MRTHGTFLLLAALALAACSDDARVASDSAAGTDTAGDTADAPPDGVPDVLDDLAAEAADSAADTVLDAVGPDTADADTADADTADAESDTTPVPEGGEPVPVPGNGWANALVASDIAPSVTWEEQEYPNVAAFPERVVGPPEGTDEAVVALGPEGRYVAVDLGEGEEAFDGDGADIVVLEMGLASGGFPEPYRVYVAQAPAGPWVVLGDGKGEQGFDLAPTGLAAARYVRVESRAPLTLIFSGLGSPLYPGPEIDAIGAVHPGGGAPLAEAPNLVVSDPQTVDAGGDGAWTPGEALDITVTLTNEGASDYMWYPGVALVADTPLVTIEPPAFWFYGIFAGMTLEATFTARAAAALTPGTTVTFEASVSALSCADNHVPCPEPRPIRFAVPVEPAPPE